MVTAERVGNVLQLEELLQGHSLSFMRAVLHGLDEVGFDVTSSFDFPDLQLARDLVDMLQPRVAPRHPAEWDLLSRLLTEAGRVGVLVDVRPRLRQVHVIPV